MYTQEYRHAIEHARHFWLRYKALPRWRWRARRQADAEMRRWIMIAIKARGSGE